MVWRRVVVYPQIETRFTRLGMAAIRFGGTSDLQEIAVVSGIANYQQDETSSAANSAKQAAETYRVAASSAPSRAER